MKPVNMLAALFVVLCGNLYAQKGVSTFLVDPPSRNATSGHAVTRGHERGTSVTMNRNSKSSSTQHRLSNLIVITETDTQETIVQKAAHVVPTQRQTDYLRTEYIGFIHWGPNTFSRREWGTGTEDVALFNPPTADTDQWCKTMKAAGMRMVVLTAKHHDGYCLWQTRYTRHSVAGSPWQAGKGDVLRELAASCRKHKLKLGVYLSPADLYQIESPQGRYGNGSDYTERTIPRPVEGRPFADKRGFTFKVDDYNEYFLNQLFELLTEYGPVHEVWFDGATPKSKGGQTYTYSAWYELIRTLVPNATIFGKGPDIRWCGNEAGKTRTSEWNVLPLDVHPDLCDWPDLMGEDLASRDRLRNAKFLYYLPAEVDTSIRDGWFYRDDTHQRVRPAAEVFDIYERSIGGNTTLILNIPPNREGRFSEADVASLLASGEWIRETYDSNLAADATSDAPEVLDVDPTTFWQPDSTTGSIALDFSTAQHVNRFLIQEEIVLHSQRVEAHALDAWVDGTWMEIARGTTVGYKKILRFDGVTTTRMRLRVLESRLPPTISRLSAHFAKIAFEHEKEAQRPTVPVQHWKVHEVTSVRGEKWGAEKAFDDNPDTFWHTAGDDAENAPQHPHHLAIDMGAEYTIVGFSYLPRQDLHVPDAMIEDWRFDVSKNGDDWQSAAEGSFGNILHDPTRRIVDFTSPKRCRYIRLVSLSGVLGKPYAGAAEINALIYE